MAQNLTLGRGKLHFARFQTGTRVPDGFMYFGNTPEFSINIESTMLDHYNSDEGLREKDESIPLETNRTGSLVTDNISPENVALFMQGEASVVATVLAAATTETISDIKLGHSYKLGVTALNPVGVMGVNPTGFAVETVGGVPLVVGVDYNMNFDTGMISFVETSTIAVAGADIEVTFAVRASTRARVLSGNQPVEGAMLYETKNPKGDDCVYYFPLVKVAPNGDYALKGDEWQQIPLTVEILKMEGVEAIYRDGLPVYA